MRWKQDKETQIEDVDSLVRLAMESHSVHDVNTPDQVSENMDKVIDDEQTSVFAYTALPIIQKQDQAGSLNSDDWTQNIPASEHVEFFRSVDWKATSMGDLTRWPHALRLHVFSIFADSRPSCLYWGPQKIAIYNAPFIPLADKSHPALMGQTFAQAYPEIWDPIMQMFDAAEKTGLAADVNEQLLIVERNGFKEETYFNGSFIPVRDDAGDIGGFYNSVHEITKQKITERRAAMLHPMTPPLTIEPYHQYILPFLERNPSDIPMVAVYRADTDTYSGICLITFCGSIGIPDGHPLMIEKTDVAGPGRLASLFREARSDIVTRPVDELFQGIEWKGFGEPSKFFSIIPVREANNLFGYMLIGANPRRPVDEDHSQFMRDISLKVCHIAASVVSAEESLKNRQRLERELESSERQIRFFAKHASVGMQNLAVDGEQVIWTNEAFYEITGLPQEVEAIGHRVKLFDAIHEEDRQKARISFRQVLDGEQNVSAELRLHRKFDPPFGKPENACILALSFPYMKDNSVSSIMTCITDVSRLKWAERFEARKAEEAQEAKRQADKFVDMISHEMRNPLSAVFQAVDAIERSAKVCQNMNYSKESLLEALKDNVESADTISKCAKHQKRIVDDVLTLSKLDYTAQLISPEPITPQNLIGGAVKMLKTDMSSHNIKLVTKLQTAFNDKDSGWMQCDPTRVTQILVNLLTNAIKFTKGGAKREINIQYGATSSQPRDMFPDDVIWAKNRLGAKDLTLNPEWGGGEHIYLYVKVCDTGVGMTQEEMKKVFGRFEQAGFKTMIRYSGSGLGLFICQQLAEVQGGEIGVKSVPNEGSTFGFYIKSRRAEPDAIALRKIQSGLGDRPKANSQARVPTLGTFAEQIHCLLVEDNMINQQILRRQLVQAGCIVHVANHGLEALAFLHETDIWYKQKEETKHLDIILMDWEMPEMDGLACSRRIRELQIVGEINRHIKIILTTANAREEQIQLAMDSGVDFVMPKPFIVSDLLSRMGEQLSPVGE